MKIINSNVTIHIKKIKHTFSDRSLPKSSPETVICMADTWVRIVAIPRIIDPPLIPASAVCNAIYKDFFFTFGFKKSIQNFCSYDVRFCPKVLQNQGFNLIIVTKM